jgi:hypothetical protein
VASPRTVGEKGRMKIWSICLQISTSCARLKADHGKANTTDCDSSSLQLMVLRLKRPVMPPTSG